MPKFSETSESKLAKCDNRIQRVLNRAIIVTDFSVLCGHRGKIAQNKAFAEKKSKAQWPDSLHNELPSLAVDIAPYPIDWDDIKRFCFLAGTILTFAHLYDVPLKWAGHWKDPWDFGHFELDDER